MKLGSILLAVLLVLGVAVPAFAARESGQLDDCIHMWIGDVVARPGENIDVPIYISNTTGWGIMAFEGKICWCETPAGLLQYESCRPGPVITGSGWYMGACGECEDNCITFTAAGINPLQGEGVFKYLTFHISANAKPCMCCSLWFDYMHLYDPENPLEVCLENGEVCIDYCSVQGYVKAWYCLPGPCDIPQYPIPVANARVHLSLCDEPIASTYTRADGYFLFDCLWPHDDPQVLDDGCPYCVWLDDCAPFPGTITAFDAALILMYLVCWDDLDCCWFAPCGSSALSTGGVYPQRVAADVNCTDVITAYDASLILQYAVGLIPAFPCPTNWVWYYMWCMDECTMNCHAKYWILGVPKGDVSGYCYRDTPFMTAAAGATVLLDVPKHFDGYVEVPVRVKDGVDVSAMQFEVSYNMRDFTVTDVRGSGLAGGFMTAFNADGGNLFIAMASSSGFTGSGEVAVITLQKNRTPMPVASTRMSIADALLNESTPAIEGRTYDAEIVRFGLGPISPNPFKESAVISYSSPRSAGVSIDIYDVHGRLIQRVYEGHAEAGTHQVIWDGRDSSGSKVARGVYFCRMNAGEFSATEKVVLLQ